MRAIIHKVLSNTLVYTCALIVMAFLYVFPFTISFATSAVKIFLIWGGAIFLYDIIVNRVLFQKKIFWVVFAFFVVTGISALVNFRNGLMRNGVFTLYGGSPTAGPEAEGTAGAQESVHHRFCAHRDHFAGGAGIPCDFYNGCEIFLYGRGNRIHFRHV